MTVVDRVFERLGKGATEDYVGEAVTQLEHALQCAALADRAGLDEVEVLAALLHDVGHLDAPPSAPRMAELGVVDHEHLGARFLESLGAPERLCRLVAGHVQAKRYLVTTRPGYVARLSAASLGTLAFQGGPMSAAEVEVFDADPLRDAYLRLRSYDEAAKVPGAKVPDLTTYGDALRRVFSAPAESG